MNGWMNERTNETKLVLPAQVLPAQVLSIEKKGGNASSIYTQLKV